VETHCRLRHTRTPAKIGIQLGHAGPKGSTQLGWEEADLPLPAGNWPLIAPSALRYGPHNQVPRAMTRDDMDRVQADFVRAARSAAACGFDWLELHCAHGYLLRRSSARSPTGATTPTAARSKIAAASLEVLRALRAVWPRTSRSRCASRRTIGRRAATRRTMRSSLPGYSRDAGADLIDVSSGQTTRDAAPVYGRMYQTPFRRSHQERDRHRDMAVGAIFEPDHVNSIVMAVVPISARWRGRTSPTRTGRCTPPHSSATTTCHGRPQYLQGKAQLERNLARAAAMAAERPEAKRMSRMSAAGETKARRARRRAIAHAPTRCRIARAALTRRPHERIAGRPEPRCRAAGGGAGRGRSRIAAPRRPSRGVAAVAASAHLHAADRASRPCPLRESRDHTAALRPHGPARAQSGGPQDGRAVASG